MRKGNPFMIRRSCNGLNVSQGGRIELDGVQCKIMTIQAIRQCKGNMVEILGWAKPIKRGEKDESKD